MRTLEFIVPEQYDGVKAYGFLRGYCGLSNRLLVAQKHVENGVTANGHLLRTIDRLHTGDIVRIYIPDDRPSARENDLPVDIIFEDEDFFVFNKPPGMPVHPSRGHENDTLANACAAHLARMGYNETFRPLGRLDRDTTGLILSARNPYAAAKLSGRTEKAYTAVCEGELSGTGTIRTPIHVKEGHGIQREAGEHGERAVTHWEALSANHGYTLLRLVLETGRTHQIRVHLSSIGHPLAGDDMYGGNRKHIGRQALHCGSLLFIHPVTHREISLTAPLPDDMVALCKTLELTSVRNARGSFVKGENDHAIFNHTLSFG